MTRRRLLRLSGAGALVLAGGTWLAMRGGGEHYRRVLAGARPVVLSEKELAVLLAVVDRLLPLEPGWLSAREARLAERIDRELTFHTRRLQSELKTALLLVEHGGLAHGRLTRFSKGSPAEQDGWLRCMAEGSDLERQAISALKVLAMFFYHCDERTWPAIHYGGPLVQVASPPEADSRLAPRPD